MSRYADLRVSLRAANRRFSALRCCTRAKRASSTIRGTGTTIHSDATFDGYRAFDGIELPMRTRRVLLHQGTRTVQQYEYDTVEHGVDLGDAVFATPPGIGAADG